MIEMSKGILRKKKRCNRLESNSGRKKSNMLLDQRNSFHGHDNDNANLPKLCNFILFLLYWVAKLPRSGHQGNLFYTIFWKWAFLLNDYNGRFGNMSSFDQGCFGSGPFRPDPFRRLTCIQGKRLKIHLFRLVKVYRVVCEKPNLIIDNSFKWRIHFCA